MKRYFSQWLVSCVATKWELGGRCHSPKPVELTPLLGEMFVFPRYDNTHALFEAIRGHVPHLFSVRLTLVPPYMPSAVALLCVLVASVTRKKWSSLACVRYLFGRLPVQVVS